MTPGTQSAAEAPKECAQPLCAAIEDRIRDARDTIEDCVAQTRLQVRRHPFRSLGAVAGAAAVLGCVVGFAVGRFRDRPSQ